MVPLHIRVRTVVRRRPACRLSSEPGRIAPGLRARDLGEPACEARRVPYARRRGEQGRAHREGRRGLG